MVFTFIRSYEGCTQQEGQEGHRNAPHVIGYETHGVNVPIFLLPVKTIQLDPLSIQERKKSAKKKLSLDLSI
jgi:hypothetical protein